MQQHEKNHVSVHIKSKYSAPRIWFCSCTNPFRTATFCEHENHWTQTENTTLNRGVQLLLFTTLPFYWLFVLHHCSYDVFV